MSSSDEWAACSPGSSGDESATPKRSTRVRKPVNYVNEGHDTFFNDRPGYTDFGRTRRGGDRRPLAVGKVSLHGLLTFLLTLTLTYIM